MSEHHYAGIDVKELLTTTDNAEFNQAIKDVFENPKNDEPPIETVVRSLTVQNSSTLSLRVPAPVLDYIQAQEALAREGKPFVNVEAMFTLHVLQKLKDQGFPIKMTGWTPEALEAPEDAFKRIQEVQARWFPSMNTISIDQQKHSLANADIRQIESRDGLVGDDMLLRVLFLIESGQQIAVARVNSQQMSGQKFIRPLTALIGFPVSDPGLIEKEDRDWFASYATQAARFLTESLVFGAHAPYEALRYRIEQALRQYAMVTLLNPEVSKAHPGCFGLPSRDLVIRLYVDEWWRDLIQLTPMHEQYSELAWIPRTGARELFLHFEEFRANRKDMAADFRIDPAAVEYLRLYFVDDLESTPAVSVMLTVEDRELS